MGEFKSLKQIEDKFNVKFSENSVDYENELLNIFNSENVSAEKCDLNNCSVLNRIGRYYYIKGNYEEMEKCYLMSISHGNVQAMISLGHHYRIIANYEKMEKYFLMAISFNDSNVMNNLGMYYHNIGNYEKMKIYFMRAV